MKEIRNEDRIDEATIFKSFSNDPFVCQSCLKVEIDDGLSENQDFSNRSKIRKIYREDKMIADNLD